MTSTQALDPCPFCGYALTYDEGVCLTKSDADLENGEEQGIGGICCPNCAAWLPLDNPSQSDAIAAWNRRAALPTEAPEPVARDATAQFLWKLLDDIDTLDDACREDDAAFRKRAYAIQRRRFEVGSTDGYAVTLAAPAPVSSAVPVKVKALEWFSLSLREQTEVRAQAGFWLYQIWWVAAPGTRFTLRTPDGNEQFETLDAAKKAGQADYEARILGALDNG